MAEYLCKAMTNCYGGIGEVVPYVAVGVVVATLAFVAYSHTRRRKPDHA